MTALTYHVLKKDPQWRPTVTTAPADRERSAEPKIRCPLCAWQPRKSDRWTCWDCLVPEGLARGCGETWHTFDTGGQCPGCFHQWAWTTCLSCGGWSRHGDWYTDSDE